MLASFFAWAAKSQVRQTVNTSMVQTYWHIGRLIVEDEPDGQTRATYGMQVLLELFERWATELGAVFSVQGLRNFKSDDPHLQKICCSIKCEPTLLTWMEHPNSKNSKSFKYGKFVQSG